ncbi:MAG: tetratricopeptide repeat protein [Bacteroidetes bacterium]|nr:tetratricopeptide repeat protein [Bacteroidota bacterium]
MRLFIIIGCLFLSKICTAQIKDAHAYNGNKLYANGKYKEATAEYQLALKKTKNKETQYNLGNSFYQQKNYEEANKQYEAASRNTKDMNLRAIAKHNMGNTFLEQKNGMMPSSILNNR